MGLSRNKVAVSEGAAGSPPFYGESGVRNYTVFQNREKNRRRFNAEPKTPLLFNFQGPENKYKTPVKETEGV